MEGVEKVNLSIYRKWVRIRGSRSTQAIFKRAVQPGILAMNIFENTSLRVWKSGNTVKFCCVHLCVIGDA